ncbi:MAG: DUF2378 family protein [Polyangiaceae bacterium]
MSFQAPRFDIPPPLAETIAALPESATCLGLYFNDVIETVAKMRPDIDMFAVANLKKRRYFPFFSYPYADMLTVMSAGSKLVHPRVSHGEALRRMGKHAYARLSETKVGNLVFGVLGKDVKRIVLAGPRGYSMSSNFGELTAQITGDKQVVYHFRNYPALLETYQVGVIEGALETVDAVGTVHVKIIDIANADIQITWE